jgi:protein transport protein DSL1/ZW10
VTSLTVHAALAQDTSDAEAIHEALSYLLQCRNAYSSVVSLVSAGKLPEAVKESANMQQLLDGLPDSLKQTAVIEDLKVGSGCLSSGFVYKGLLPFSKSSVPLVPALRTN